MSDTTIHPLDRQVGEDEDTYRARRHAASVAGSIYYIDGEPFKDGLPHAPHRRQVPKADQGKTGLSQRIADFLEDRPMRSYSDEAIASALTQVDTGLFRPGKTGPSARVRSSLDSMIRRHPKRGIERPRAGLYRYNPDLDTGERPNGRPRSGPVTTRAASNPPAATAATPAPPTPDSAAERRVNSEPSSAPLFEVVGTAEDDDLVLRRDDGSIWKAYRI